MTIPELTDFLWKIANLLRDDFRRGRYADVILPLTVLRRVDCVLAPTKAAVLAEYDKRKDKIDNINTIRPVLVDKANVPFFNISKFDFPTLLKAPGDLRLNMLDYINGFSENMLEILEKFQFQNILQQLEDAGILYMVVQRFSEVDLSPHHVSNDDMGTVFEELIRKFNEMLDENPGEHFTPPEVVKLMVRLVIGPDEDVLNRRGVIRTLYDPACGTGRMLSGGEREIHQVNPNAHVILFGQEVNPETWAVCKADMLIKGDTDAEIAQGSTLSKDAFPKQRFHYMICNPPYGKEWKKDQAAVLRERERDGADGRFGAGLPRISDGQLLFLQTMVGKMEPVNGDYSRIAIVMNGSPLFTGDAGAGETEIRRWLLERDLVEAIIGLPDQMFYNTGINTYIWVLTNKKRPERVGTVQLIDAREIYAKMRPSLGDKRNRLLDEHIEDIYRLYEECRDEGRSRLFDNADFGYRRITVERPLRLNFAVTEERLARLWDESGFANLDQSRKRKDEAAAQAEKERGAEEQERILTALRSMGSPPAPNNGGVGPPAPNNGGVGLPAPNNGGVGPPAPNNGGAGRVWTNRAEFWAVVDAALKAGGVRPAAPVKKAILNALGERDETADVCVDSQGQPEADTELRDYENVPLKEDVQDYFRREVEPHVKDAWIRASDVDPKDRQVGRVGYEINFNRHFYKFTPPRPLEEIESDIRSLEREILTMLSEVTGARNV